MSNQQNDTYIENYFDFLEEQGEKYLKSKKKSPFELIQDVDDMIFNSILNTK